MTIDVLDMMNLFGAFPGSYINHNGEFIAHERANEYFCLENCKDIFEVKCKVLEQLSRGAHKTCPFSSNRKNEQFHNFMLNGINDFLDTDFTEEDISLVYDRLGNGVNRSLTENFIKGNYSMKILDRGNGDLFDWSEQNE